MGRQSQSAAWSTAVVMGLKVTLGCLLACSVSSVPLDAGYGVPAAPLILAPHQPAAAPLPLQLVHAAPQPVPLPVIHNHAQPIFHSAPEPLIQPLPAPAPFVPAPLPLFQEPQLLAPAPVPVPIQAPSSQFHAQDEFGQFSFGYENINSAKTETKDAFGVTRGSYQYIDANGIVQTVNYIADDVNGFRVAGTNIPTAPAALPAALPIGPAPVAETPEVAAARAAHLAAHDEALAAAAEIAADATEERKKRSPEGESEPTPEPEPEPEPEADRKKREAEPIDGDYEVPAAPVLVSSPVVHAAPVAVSAPVHLPQPAPLFHHAPLHPAPFVQPALPHVPAHPFSVPQPSALPFVPAPQPILAPEPIFAPAPQPIAFAPEPIALAPEPLPLFHQPELLAPIPVPIQAPSSQFHAQDEFGQFSFGYENINSAKTETKDAFGVTRGSYQYVDANGIIQTVNYIADDINGFRVAGTNIPVAVAGAQPAAPAALPLVAPVPVLETPEVAAARAEHLAAHAEAKAAVDAANAKEEEL